MNLEYDPQSVPPATSVFDVDAPDGAETPKVGCGSGIETYHQFSPWVKKMWKLWMAGSDDDATGAN